MTRPRHLTLGLIAILFTLALDQGFKLWMLFGFDIADRGIVSVGPYLDLVMAWNKGISYGLFQQDGEVGRWVLVAIKAAAAVVFGAWLLKAETRPTALGLGLVIGGALGNGIDRVLWGRWPTSSPSTSAAFGGMYSTWPMPRSCWGLSSCFMTRCWGPPQKAGMTGKG